LARCGLEPRDIWLDAGALRAHPHASPFSWDVGDKRNVVASWPAAARGGRSLTLCGHIDVVPPAASELWSSPPFEPRHDGDWLYGRGSGDMKAGLVAIVGSVRALREADVRLGADVHASPPAPFDMLEHPINLNPGVITGGDWASTAPARCTLSCRLALYPDEDPRALQMRVEEAITAVADAHPFLRENPPRVRYD